jgi:hypothetical protein
MCAFPLAVALDACFQSRLTYAYMCGHLCSLEDSVLDTDTFEAEFLPQVTTLRVKETPSDFILSAPQTPRTAATDSTD